MNHSDPDAKLAQWRQIYEARSRLTPKDYLGLLRANIHYLSMALIALYLIASWSGVFGWGHLPELQLQAATGMSSSDPCELRERCIIAYVAPWCPSCIGSVGFLNQLKSRVDATERVGMKIITGMDSTENLEIMAKKFRSSVFFDPGATYAHQIGVRSVPSVLVADNRGEILEKGLPGALGGMPSAEENLDVYIESVLGLKEFF